MLIDILLPDVYAARIFYLLRYALCFQYFFIEYEKAGPKRL